jgi:5S rRNA maturation endonuclease (ribonuclease M5)
MADTSTIDLVSLIEQESPVRFSKAAGNGTKRTQKASCPWCGGDDRFAVFTNEIPQRYYCGIHGGCGCGVHGDAIDFLREYRAIGYHEACDVLSVDAGSQYNGPTKRRQEEPSDDQPPCDAWQKRGIELCAEWKETLWSDRGKPALAWLHGRDFTDETVKSAALGYNPTNRYDTPEKWGLPADHDPLWIPRGIVIPWQLDGCLWKVNIRRGDKDIAADRARAETQGISPKRRKYINVPGGSQGLYGASSIKAGEPVILVEGEFDRLALLQATERSVAVVATGGTSHAHRARWIEALTLASPVLVTCDSDASGKQARRTWVQEIPGAVAWLPWAHDINDMLVQGIGIKQWVDVGLEVARTPVAVPIVEGTIHLPPQELCQEVPPTALYQGQCVSTPNGIGTISTLCYFAGTLQCWRCSVWLIVAPLGGSRYLICDASEVW